MHTISGLVNGIKITDVVIYPFKPIPGKNNTIKAAAKVVLNDCFIISGIKVVEGKNGLFIAFPQEFSKDQEKHYDICYPITAELRSYFSARILDQFSTTINSEVTA